MPGHWLLTGAREATPGAEAIGYDTLSIPSSLDGRNALERYARQRRCPSGRSGAPSRAPSRPGFRHRLPAAAAGALATPLLFAAMSILAAAFSLRLIRLGGVATLAGAGVALGFGLFFFNPVLRRARRRQRHPAIRRRLDPAGVALLSGFTLLFYTEDG